MEKPLAALNKILADSEKLKHDESLINDALVEAKMKPFRTEVEKVVIDPVYTDKTGLKRLYCQFLDKIRVSP
jgi:hypothetical protein